MHGDPSIDVVTLQQANARLVASAPDLLEALETCMGWLLDKCNCVEDCGCVPEKAIAAVRKAKGEL
jgi:hypothetical protein